MLFEDLGLAEVIMSRNSLGEKRRTFRTEGFKRGGVRNTACSWVWLTGGRAVGSEARGHRHGQVTEGSRAGGEAGLYFMDFRGPKVINQPRKVQLPGCDLTYLYLKTIYVSRS